MNVRNVRLLDRERGQPADDQTRLVNGVVIDKAIPLPKVRADLIELTEVLNAMEVGESFLHGYRVKGSTVPGRKFTNQKQPNGKYRVWRVK